MLSALLGFLIAVTGSAQAYIENAKTPLCFRGDTQLNIDNRQVLTWKSTSKNQYTTQAYISGVMEGSLTNSNSHYRFMVRLGDGPKDIIEVVYNNKFGSMPKLEEGMEITICGEYITSNAPTQRYQPSPAGAIIHWVHQNPGDRKGSANHPHGFIMVNGSTLIGFDTAKTGAWDGELSGYKPGER